MAFKTSSRTGIDNRTLAKAKKLFRSEKIQILGLTISFRQFHCLVESLTPVIKNCVSLNIKHKAFQHSTTTNDTSYLDSSPKTLHIHILGLSQSRSSPVLLHTTSPPIPYKRGLPSNQIRPVHSLSLSTRAILLLLFLTIRTTG